MFVASVYLPTLARRTSSLSSLSYLSTIIGVPCTDYETNGSGRQNTRICSTLALFVLPTFHRGTDPIWGCIRYLSECSYHIQSPLCTLAEVSGIDQAAQRNRQRIGKVSFEAHGWWRDGSIQTNNTRWRVLWDGRKESGCDQVLYVCIYSLSTEHQNQISFLLCGPSDRSWGTQKLLFTAQLDMRRLENYGFASISSIPLAHAAARELRGQHPKGLTIKLAPNPKDIASSQGCSAREFLSDNPLRSGKILACRSQCGDSEEPSASSCYFCFVLWV